MLRRRLTIFILALAIALAAGFGYDRVIRPRGGGGEHIDTPKVSTPIIMPLQQNLQGIFKLNEKVSGTKIYYSDKLGIGFTYIPNPTSDLIVKVTEIGNKIYIHNANKQPETGQSVEVFIKDPGISIEEAIKNKFLTGYNPRDCFVKIYDDFAASKHKSDYVYAGISFSSENDPRWSKNSKCPQNYSETMGLQYFFMNKDVPEKFAFVRVGQYFITSDGTPGARENEYNWSFSIQVLK